MHEAIKLITETLALHLPAHNPNSALETIKPSTAEAAPSAKTSENEVITAASPPDLTSQPSAISMADTLVETPSPTSPPKRPNLEKRSSLLGSMGKIFWPFGSASPNKTVIDGTEVVTADMNAPKVTTVTISEVPLTPGIEA